jgi:hypothetical protein
MRHPSDIRLTELWRALLISITKGPANPNLGGPETRDRHGLASGRRSSPQQNLYGARELLVVGDMGEGLSQRLVFPIYGASPRSDESGCPSVDHMFS